MFAKRRKWTVIYFKIKSLMSCKVKNKKNSSKVWILSKKKISLKEIHLFFITFYPARTYYCKLIKIWQCYKKIKFLHKCFSFERSIHQSILKNEMKHWKKKDFFEWEMIRLWKVDVTRKESCVLEGKVTSAKRPHYILYHYPVCFWCKILSAAFDG